MGECGQTRYPDTPTLDPTEAPPGYYAVLKANVKTDALGNICRACDFRSNCDASRFRCMSYELANGLKRNDKCSVVFKKRVRAVHDC